MAKKIILSLALFCSVAFLLSAPISLLLPEKLRAHTYQRLFYALIAEKETTGLKTLQEKASRIFSYLIDHEFKQGVPYSCRPLESLIYGEAYCDFQARTLNVLLAACAIPSRYAMLMDKEGISRHTLNEVFLNGKWAVFDPTFNIIFRQDENNLLSLEELSKDFALIERQEKLLFLKDHHPTGYESLRQAYAQLFPLPLAPRRSEIEGEDDHLLDWMADLYFKFFKERFFYPYQDIYLKIKESSFLSQDAYLFYLARNYHLSYRRELAQKYYRSLLDNYPQSGYLADTLFFQGVLFFEKRDFTLAKDNFRLLLDKYPAKWDQPAYYYLGKTLDALGDHSAAVAAYRQADREE